jgi:serine/threonine protein kinase
MDTYSILSKSIHHTIFIISDTEIGKSVHKAYKWVEADTGEEVFQDSHQDNIDNQIAMLQLANSINKLMVKFIRKEIYLKKEMIVMERLYPLPYDHFDRPKRQALIADLESQLKELHRNGFVHGDLVQPRGPIPQIFDNIVLTESGFRLVDTGFSMSLEKEDIRGYVRKQIQEEKELEVFKNYFLDIN